MSKKREVFITPKAEAVWAFLDKPSDKFNPDGVYTVSLAFEAEDPDFKKLVKVLRERRDESFEKWARDNPKQAKAAKPAPISKKETDAEEAETGRRLLTFKMISKGKSRRTGNEYSMTPDIFDAKGEKMEHIPPVGGGSVLKVAFEVFGAYVASSRQFYLSLQLRAVQIIELVEAGSHSAEYYGFEEEEGGYVANAGAPRFPSDGDDDDDDGKYADKAYAQTKTTVADDDDDFDY